MVGIEVPGLTLHDLGDLAQFVLKGRVDDWEVPRLTVVEAVLKVLDHRLHFWCQLARRHVHPGGLRSPHTAGSAQIKGLNPRSAKDRLLGGERTVIGVL